ncbi:MAG: ElyC/SanA/YdcF family protein [Patescibacteria group bacterium]
MDEEPAREAMYQPSHVHTFRIPWHWIIFFGFLGANFIFFSILTVQIAYHTKIANQPYLLPQTDVAMVLGASVNKDGTPSDALADRITTAVDLYNGGTVKTILLTGDDGKHNADEIDVMKKAVEDLGVPDKDILIDGHGYRTYESCKNAIQTFHITSMIVVTQKFHLPRALFLCNELGIDSVGYVADKRHYASAGWFQFRDLLASVKAFWDVYVQNPRPSVKI